MHSVNPPSHRKLMGKLLEAEHGLFWDFRPSVWNSRECYSATQIALQVFLMSHKCERHSEQLSRQVTASQHFQECSRNFSSECCRGSVLVFFDCAHHTAEWFTSLGTHSPCAGSGNTALCCTVQIQDVPSSHCGMLFSLWKEQKQMDMLHLS